jgi:GDPmannose 4,6-dehydratase
LEGAGTVQLGNLSVRRDWLHASDTMNAMAMLGCSASSADMVVSRGVDYSIADWCNIAFSHVGLDWRDHVRVDGQLVRTESAASFGDSTRLRESLGWSPSVEFVDLVTGMVDVAIAEAVGDSA